MPARPSRTNDSAVARAPVWIIGVLLVAFGMVGLLTGGGDFSADPFNGDVAGEVLLGIEANGWTNALFVVNGGLLILASVTLLSARFVAVAVGLDFAAAAAVALIDGSNVLGVFATNGATQTVWAVLALVLLVLAVVGPRESG
jgi:hypothetical protein